MAEISPELQEKQEKLRAYFAACGKVMIAFSGGVDSTFLLKTAHDVLGDGAIAVTASSCFFPGREQGEARAFCESEGIRQIVLQYDVLGQDGVKENPPDRCYFCKRGLLEKVCALAKQMQIPVVAEGSNLDDTRDYRPGARAVAELQIQSPLKDIGFSKQEIRILSHALGLSTWGKPAYACLASRFVYGETITEEKLRRVDLAEQLLIDLGFLQMRVRTHGDMARIELPAEDMERFFQREIRERVTSYLKEAGFSWVTLDLEGFRSGSMNLDLNREDPCSPS